MGAIAEAVRHMVKAGMPADAIAEAVSAMEQHAFVDEAAERRRAKDRERKRLAKQGILRNSAEDAEQAEGTPPKKEKSPPTPPSKEKTPPPSSRRDASKCFDREFIVEALAEVLDADHATAVADYRMVGRKDKFSLYAARLLAKELAKAPEPNSASEAMIRNGWQGFEVDWLKRRQGFRVVQTNPDPPRKSGAQLMTDTGMEMLEEMQDDQAQFWNQGRTVDGYAHRR